MPFVIYVLGLGIFAEGTSEFMLSGVMPSIAQDLDIPLASAGMLVSAFAIGMLVGAPLMSLVTLKMPRRAALVGFQLVFIAAHVGAALVPHFGFLLVMRVLSAMAYAGFWAMASVAAISLVGADKQGRAMGVVVSGLSVATIIGVPGGTLLAQHAGWEAAFWAVAAMTALSTIALLIVLPGGRDTTTAQPRLATEVRSLMQPRLWVAYATTALTVAAQFAIFSYLGALLEDVTGLSTGLVPLVLGLYGVGAFIGLTIGGRVADRAPFTPLLMGMAAFIVAATALAVTAHVAWGTIALVVLLGAANFGVTPAVNARVFSILGGTRTLGGAVNIAAFNVGIAVAPLASGLVINTGLGLAGTAWIGAAFGVAHMGSVLLDRHLTRRHEAGTEEPTTVFELEHAPAAS
ncbi:MFS transporter [Streptomyces mirabilis]|uniref:Cmx/CmrA family chloramphenicol efflux MFS transporter n=1 Tax=Streptomyces mirabilis TaxID=68239 RepID=UPI002E201CCE|nr:Cmx/CmrA family chloramphenicol efflux MFS transporter [Streptomyces mirabilis]